MPFKKWLPTREKFSLSCRLCRIFIQSLIACWQNLASRTVFILNWLVDVIVRYHKKKWFRLYSISVHEFFFSHFWKRLQHGRRRRARSPFKNATSPKPLWFACGGVLFYLKGIEWMQYSIFNSMRPIDWLKTYRDIVRKQNRLHE